MVDNYRISWCVGLAGQAAGSKLSGPPWPKVVGADDIDLQLVMVRAGQHLQFPDEFLRGRPPYQLVYLQEWQDAALQRGEHAWTFMTLSAFDKHLRSLLNRGGSQAAKSLGAGKFRLLCAAHCECIKCKKCKGSAKQGLVWSISQRAC